MNAVTNREGAPQGASDPDPVVRLVLEFWREWYKYLLADAEDPDADCDTLPGYLEAERLVEDICSQLPTTLAGLVASANLFSQLAESGFLDDYARKMCPITLADVLPRLTGVRAPCFQFKPDPALSRKRGARRNVIPFPQRLAVDNDTPKAGGITERSRDWRPWLTLRASFCIRGTNRAGARLLTVGRGSSY